MFILSLALYVATMCRTVFWWDTGELAANAGILGIPHRPGFPLYVIVAHLMTLTPFGDVFYRVNFLSAASAAVALAFLAYLWYELAAQQLRPRRRWEAIAPVTMSLLAMAGTYTLWMQAVRAEVYAPNLMLVTLLFGCVWGADRAVRNGSGQATQWMCAAGFVGGLGLCVHNATFASVLPAVLLFLIALDRRQGFGLRAWLSAALLFILGLSVYLYLPIRATQHPSLNWGWEHALNAPGWGAIVGSDALGAVFATAAKDWIVRCGQSCVLLFDQLAWGVAALALWGVVLWWRRARRWCLVWIGVFVGNVAVTALLVSDFNDTNADIHGYLVPALAAVGFFMAGGNYAALRGLLSLPLLLPTRWLYRSVACLILATILLLALAPVVINAPYCNLVGHRLAYDLGTEATADLKPGAIVFVSGTNFDFVLRGLQYCEHWRSDLRILNRDLLPSAWYRQWTFDRYPDLAAYTIPTDSVRLHLSQWATNLAAAGYPVYWEFTETSMDILRNLVPAGHLFAVSPSPIADLEPRMLRAQEDFERRSRFYGSSKRIRYDYDAQRVWVANLYRAGIYYESRGLLDRARDLFQRALSAFRDDPSRAAQGVHLTRAVGVPDSVMARVSKSAALESGGNTP